MIVKCATFKLGLPKPENYGRCKGEEKQGRLVWINCSKMEESSVGRPSKQKVGV